MTRRAGQGHPGGATPFSRSPEGRRTVARPTVTVILMAVFVTTIALAYAGPVDPTWIGGIYDDADYYDFVILLTETNNAVTAGSTEAASPVAAFARIALDSHVPVSDTAALLAFHLRSPPGRLTSLLGSPAVSLITTTRQPHQLKPSFPEFVVFPISRAQKTPSPTEFLSPRG